MMFVISEPDTDLNFYSVLFHLITIKAAVVNTTVIETV